MIAGRKSNGAKPGDQSYMRTFQVAVTEFMEGLNENQVLELEIKRAEWINISPPAEVQRKTAEKRSRSFLKSSAETQYREMGMRSVVWEFHVNPYGQKLFQLLSPQIIQVNIYLTHFCSHDYNDTIGKVKLQTFGEKFPEAVQDFKGAWMQYMLYCELVEEGEEVQSVAQSRMSTTLIHLDRDPKGYPLVPQEGGNLINMKRIIRSFITIHYRKYQFFLFQQCLISLNPQVLLLARNTIGSHGNKSKNALSISLNPDISLNPWMVSHRLKIQVI